jgi:hypothetical protein
MASRSGEKPPFKRLSMRSLLKKPGEGVSGNAEPAPANTQITSGTNQHLSHSEQKGMSKSTKTRFNDKGKLTPL